MLQRIRAQTLGAPKTSDTSPHGTGASGRNWPHAPDALMHGNKVTYRVRILGKSECNQCKGTEVVKAAIRKLKFEKSIKKTEGVKPTKVDLVICIDGVVILDAKTSDVLYNYPLHRISYCADDKSDKRMLSFIAKDSSTTYTHQCFVFDSQKCAELITLTIGQAFDLAYKRFQELNGKELEGKKRLVYMQARIEVLENENRELRKRVAELEGGVDVEATKPANGLPVTQHDELNPHTLLTRTDKVVVPVGLPTTQDGFIQVPSNGIQPPPPVPRRRERVVSPTHRPRTHSSPHVSVVSGSPTAAPRHQIQQSINPFNPFKTGPVANQSGSGSDMSISTGSGTGTQATGTGIDPSTSPFNTGARTTPTESVLSDWAEQNELFARGLAYNQDDFDIADLDPLKT